MTAKKSSARNVAKWRGGNGVAQWHNIISLAAS